MTTTLPTLLQRAAPDTEGRLVLTRMNDRPTWAFVDAEGEVGLYLDGLTDPDLFDAGAIVAFVQAEFGRKGLQTECRSCPWGHYSFQYPTSEGVWRVSESTESLAHAALAAFVAACEAQTPHP